MAGKQLTGDALSTNFAGMSKNQLYDIMSQMKNLIEQNQQQARQILIQNPLLTKALFQAQIMLGMVQPPQALPNIQVATSQPPQQAAQVVQQPNIPATQSLQVQTGSQDQTSVSQSQNLARNQQPSQTAMSSPSTSVAPLNQSSQSHPMPALQPPRGHHNPQTAAMPLPQSSQVPNMTPLPLQSATQPPPLLQPPMQAVSNQLQKPMQTSAIPHLPLQPPLPLQPRPPSVQTFPHQHYSHMGPNVGFQHPGAPQMHHSQPMFHPGGMGPPFSQGQPPLSNQPLPQSIYQGGGSHLGMEFNQMGSSTQADRGSAWMPGPPENTSGSQLPGAPSPFVPGQMSVGVQPSRSSTLTPDMEMILLQQVMSLTPEQINLLPPDQRSQVLQLQQMMMRQ